MSNRSNGAKYKWHALSLEPIITRFLFIVEIAEMYAAAHSVRFEYVCKFGGEH